MSATTETTIEEIAASYGEAWNSQDLEAILQRHAEQGIFHLHAGAEPVAGKEAVRAAFAGFIAQFPDIHFAAQRLLTSERGWTLESTLSGTLAQELPVSEDLVAKPGGRIEVDCLDLIVVDDGLITEKHTYLDQLEMMRQLGVLARA